MSDFKEMLRLIKKTGQEISFRKRNENIVICEIIQREGDRQTTHQFIIDDKYNLNYILEQIKESSKKVNTFVMDNK